MPAPSRPKSASAQRASHTSALVDAKRRLASDPSERDRMERRQLDDYIKRRSDAIDRDIEELRTKLTTSSSSSLTNNLLLSGAHDGGNNNSSGMLASSNQRQRMEITGASLGVGASTSTSGRGGTSTSARGTSGNSTSTSRLGSIRDADLRAFLSMLSDAVYEAGLSVDDIWAVLPRGTSLERPYVSIFDLRDALEIDLMLPFDDTAERLVMRHYAVNGDSRSIDVLRLFGDADIHLDRASTSGSRSSARGGGGGMSSSGGAGGGAAIAGGTSSSTSSLRVMPRVHTTSTRRQSPYGVDEFGDAARGGNNSDDSDLEIDVERRRRLIEATSRSATNDDRDVARQSLYNDAFASRHRGAGGRESGRPHQDDEDRRHASMGRDPPATRQPHPREQQESNRGYATTAEEADGISTSTRDIKDDDAAAEYVDRRPMRSQASTVQHSVFDDLIDQANKNAASLGGLHGLLEDLPSEENSPQHASSGGGGIAPTIDEDDRFIDSILERYGSQSQAKAKKSTAAQPSEPSNTSTSATSTTGSRVAVPGVSRSVDVEAEALRRENERLRRELAQQRSGSGNGISGNGGGDATAEEELNELKAKYARLKATASADSLLLDDIDPSSGRYGRAGGNNTNASTSTSATNGIGAVTQSFDRLARGAKSSIRAMDRAGILASEYGGGRTGGSYGSTGRRSSPLFDAELVPVASGPKPSYLPKHMTSQYSLAVPEHHAARPEYFIAADDPNRGPDGATFSDLCERRLIFEISNHRDPLKVYRDLLRGIVEIARFNGVDKTTKDKAAPVEKEHKSNDPLTAYEAKSIPEAKTVSSRYVTPVQFYNIANQLHLNLSLSEVQLIAAGFASDGAGGFDVEEFCEALQALMYSFDSKMFGASRREDEGRGSNKASSKSKSRSLGGGNTSPTRRFLTERLGKSYAEDACGDDEDAYNMTSTTTRGGGGAMSRSLGSGGRTTSGMGRRPMYGTRGGKDDPGDVVATRSDMDTYWMIVEFDFVDELLSQLESLTPAERRRRLLSLRHMLWNAETFARNSAVGKKSKYIEDDDDEALLLGEDTNKLGDEIIDGFALLKCLVNCGFDIPRAQRAKFLTAMEKMGGRVKFTELFRILMSGCCDWPKVELAVATKLLTAMGATVPQRRVWIARLRSDLNKLSGYSERENPSSKEDEDAGNSKTRRGGKAAESTTRGAPTAAMNGDDDVENPGVSASAFLYALRDLGAGLTIEEEAILLDCLDLERQSEVIATTGHTRTIDNSSDVKAPSVYYKSFLAFCTRYAGDWTMFLPDLFDKLKDSVARQGQIAHDEVNALKSVFISFDDKFHGRMPRRSFLVACRRSALFEDLSGEELGQLAEVLSADGGGTIDYRNFMYYLQSLALVARSSVLDRSVAGRIAPGSFKILASLMDGGTDTDGTFVPLRTWLLRALDEVSDDTPEFFDAEVGSSQPAHLPQRVFVQMLRDFGVVYDNEDLDQLLEELGLVAASLRLDSVSSSGGHRLVKAELYSDYIDVRALFVCLFTVRGPWTRVQPTLAEKLRRCYETAPRGAVKRLVARLDNFAIHSTRPYVKFIGGRHVMEEVSRKHSVSSMAQDDAGDVDIAVTVAAKGDVHSRIVRRDVFLRVAEACGIYIEEDDAFLLSDATDVLPQSEYVEYASALLLPLRDDFDNDEEAADTLKGQVAQKMRQARRAKDQVDSQSFAMKHFRSQMMKAAGQQKRTANQWKCDVDSVFRGFDRGGGFVTAGDFKIALKIIGVHISNDLFSSLVASSGAAYNSAELIDFEAVLTAAFATNDNDMDGDAASGAPSASTRKAYEAQASRTKAGSISRNVKQQRSGAPDTTSSSSLALASRKRSGAYADDMADTAATQGRKAPGPAVKSLVHVIRRGMERFIVDGSDIEEAAHDLISVLYKFDTNNDGCITPRDFCLAVSILLGGDDIVLSKEEWGEVIKYFTATPSQKHSAGSSTGRPPLSGTSTTTSSTRNAKADVMVDYVGFVEMVLDTAELRKVKSKLLDLEPGGDERNGHATRSSGSSARLSMNARERLAGAPARSSSSGNSTSTRALLNSDPSRRRTLKGHNVSFGAGDIEPPSVRDDDYGDFTSTNSSSGSRYNVDFGGRNKASSRPSSASRPGSARPGSSVAAASSSGSSTGRNAATAGASSRRPQTAHSSSSSSNPSARGRSALAQQKSSGFTTARPGSRMLPGDAAPAGLTPKQRSKAKSMGLTEADVHELEEFKAVVSEALEQKSSTGRRSKYDILYEALMAEDSNRGGSLSVHSIIAALSSLGIRSKKMRELLVLLSSKNEDKQIVIDDLLDILGEE